jgi:16S rRNA C1402 (ribose-2'-O) methylase RsmI
MHPLLRRIGRALGLTVVPLPIGNWLDLTPAAYQALARADLILCEDTRVTGNMFKALREKQIQQQLEEFCGQQLECLPEYAEEGGENVLDKFNQMDKAEQARYMASLDREDYLRFKYNLLQLKKQRLLLDIEDLPHSSLTEKVLETRIRKSRGVMFPLSPANMPALTEQFDTLISQYRVVLVCDRGVPGISDPGHLVCQLAKGRL